MQFCLLVVAVACQPNIPNAADSPQPTVESDTVTDSPQPTSNAVLPTEISSPSSSDEPSDTNELAEPTEDVNSEDPITQKPVAPELQWSIATGDAIGLFVRSDGWIYAFVQPPNRLNLELSLVLISPTGVVESSSPIVFDDQGDIVRACTFGDNVIPVLYAFDNGDLVCSDHKDSLIISQDGTVEHLFEKLGMSTQSDDYRRVGRSGFSDYLAIYVENEYVYVASTGEVAKRVEIDDFHPSSKVPALSALVHTPPGETDWYFHQVNGEVAYSGPLPSEALARSSAFLGMNNGVVYAVDSSTDALGNPVPDTWYRASSGEISTINVGLQTIRRISEEYGINVFELQYVPSSKAIVHVSNGSVIQLSDDFEIIRIITVEGTGTVGNDGAYYRWLRGNLEKYLLPLIPDEG